MRAPGLLLAALTTLGSCKPGPPGDDITTTTTSATTTTNPGASTTSGPDPTSLTPTSTTTDATSTSTTGTTADDFILRPDGGGPISECDGLQQLDPECRPGKKCTINGALSVTHCVDIARDPTGLYEPCTAMGDGFSGHDDCDLGLLCWDVDEQGHGTCIGLCDGDFDSCACADPFATLVFCQDCAVGLCLPDCDPLLQDCVGTDLCIPNQDGTGFICVLDASGDAGQANDPCEFENSCDKALLCLTATEATSACPPGPTGCCQPFCDLGDMSPCPNPDQQCVPWFDPMDNIPPNLENLGICKLPP